MNWAQGQRMHFIGVCLKVYGYINRGSIMEMYGLSRPQAAADIAAYLERHPGRMTYNLKTRRYEATT